MHGRDATGGGQAVTAIDRALANVHPARQRLFADCAARAGAAGTDEIRRWKILRRFAFSG